MYIHILMYLYTTSQRVYGVYSSCTAVPTRSPCLAAALRHGRKSGFTWRAHASDGRFYRYGHRRCLVHDVSGTCECANAVVPYFYYYYYFLHRYRRRRSPPFVISFENHRRRPCACRVVSKQ